MKPHPGPPRALAATARLANIPSVLSNVWLGIVLGLLPGGNAIDFGFWCSAALLCVSGTCLYLAGNFLNDWADREWDAARRPERALPRGLFSPALYLSLACGLLLAGIGAAARAHAASLPVTLSIAIGILLYTWLHKHTAWSVIPLSLCRALLPLLGFVAVSTTGETQFSMAACGAGLGLFCHIIGLSLFARHESKEQTRHVCLHPASVLFALAAWGSFSNARFVLDLPLLPCLAGLAAYGMWVIFPRTRPGHPISSQVSHLLAGIPLVDWMLLLPIFLADQTQAMPPVIAITCLCLPPLAVLAGKALQRYAPAT
ncbi:MAG: UbiA family prenyltransferase [Luteolibacter sp.]|nr:UbiA family prenyltransferase [Luteolibacter sp.]